MMQLESDKIKLRPLEPEDIDIIYEWENDPEVWKISHTQTPYSKYILKKFIENSHLDIYETKQYRFIIDLKKEKKTETIGTIDLFDYDPYHSRIGVGILIKENEHRQKGYASEALRLLTDYVFNKLLIHQIYCNICPYNKASLKLFLKHGFKVVGLKKDWLKTSDGWQDEYLLQLVNPNS